ncbi:MAG TPA: iron-sulfur cluster loop [Spirochaetota bacterium]|nr:iron-sulfur cluster loop [Spirochaetota bacterium]
MLLVDIGKRKFRNECCKIPQFVKDETANNLLTDLNKYSHAYLLACLMDRQIKAERAWMIPHHVSKEIGSFEIEILKNVSQKEMTKIFSNNKLHRFNDTMSKVFYEGIKDIVHKYAGDASAIWKNKPSSSSVVYKFLEFKGSGIKISTMAANILARQFKIPFSDYYSIDISPDVHIIRVMKRMGLVPQKANNDMIIYKARELNPEFPGIIDSSCWEIGRTWCRPNCPDCNACIVNKECAKNIGRQV